MPSFKRPSSPDLLASPSPHNALVTLVASSSSNADSMPTPTVPVTRLKRARTVKDEVFDVSSHPKTRRNRSSRSLASTSSLKLESVNGQTETSLNTPQATSKRHKSSGKSKVIKQSLDVPHPPPERWKEIYDTIKEMRAQTIAPVDTMGCDQAQHMEKDPKVCPIFPHAP